MNRRLSQVLVVTCAAFATLAFAPAAPAAAHVTVTPTTVTAGGRATLTFKMPNESDDAKTVQLEVAFPENAALTSVSLRPVPGWTATVNRKAAAEAPAQSTEDDHAASTGAVTSIVWRSDTGVGQGEFQTFDVAVGPLPKEPMTLVFKALQTYSDGAVVRWIETPQDGAKLAHPAMVVTVAAPPAPPAAPVDPGPLSGNGLSLAALAVGLLALGVAFGALLRPRRPLIRTVEVPILSGNPGKQPVKAGRR